MKLEREIRERLGKLPKDLEAAYREIVDNMSKTDRIFFDRACQWILVAYKPLESNAMLKAVCQDPYTDVISPVEDMDEDVLLECCHNLLVIDPSRKVWIASHLSVIEFIESSLWSRQDAHYFVGTLTLLSVNSLNQHREASTQLHELSDGKVSESSSIESIILYPPSEFSSWEEYSSRYWMIHTTNCDFAQDKLAGFRLSSLLKRFLVSPNSSSQAYKNWSRGATFAREIAYVTRRGGTTSSYAELQPNDVSAFAICAYGLYEPLLDWWELPWTNLKVINEEGKSLLVLAIESGCLSACEALVKWGADVNEQFDRW